MAKPVEFIDETAGDWVVLPARITSPGDDCPYSLEALDQMQSERGGRPLKEIWKSLGAK